MRNGYTVTYQMRKQQRQRREKIIQYILKFVTAVFFAFIIVRFICFSYTIQGDSMAPTFEKGEKHLVNRIIYQVKKPSRYDIIVFGLDDEKNKSYYVKRVVGLPGETVEVKDGRIYINGKRTQAFSKEKILSPGLASDKITLKKNQYFVIGDNYNNSEDSRSASIGNVKRENIIGKVSFKYWPWG
ncbi:MAG: signal peptidase I [Anaerostipes faecalis]|nr:signal peptidase I [Anaerostipes faecalis]